ncbi:condensation domain-containing protein [Dactylosporangium fulvum]|uniref:Condensation domain-containing protein n=1 Tax=Dactylosporangium fulvum TaxID=53359 RepID=A0ABY5VUK0_9ACTN|nr:condensation domain-containing protein [Dactylosporangium fulvum]UWP80173.1 condensation domain-containing protein [Dactylosporangium fulvum]
MTRLDVDKQRLLMKLLRERGTAVEAPRIAPVPPGTAVPLNSPQARIWFSCRQYPDSSEYSMPDLRIMERALDLATLRAATAELMARHDILRVRMFERDGVPMQQDCGPIEPPVTWHDLRHLPADEAAALATEISNRAVQRPFPLDEPCFFTIIGFALPGDRTMLTTNFHHLVVDGLSRLHVVRELDALLAGRPLDPPAPAGFLDYVAWERENTDEAVVQRDLSYWTDKLAGDLPVLDLPRDHPRPAVSSRTGHTVPVTIPGPLLARLQRLAADEGVTLFVVVLAAYKLFLARMAGQRDILVGTPLAGRDHEVAESIVGCFVKSVPLRTDLSGDPTFREVVRRVHETLLEAHDHQAVPYDRVVAELGLPRLSGVHQVFQTMVNLQLPGGGAGGAADVGVELDTNSAMWDLALSLSTDGDGLGGIIVYSADLFDRRTALRFADVLEGLLVAAAERPDARAFELPLLAPAERDRVLHGLNRYGRPDVPYRTLAQPFEEQVRRAPDAIALRGDEGQVSYAELNARANRLAWFLRDTGVRPGTVVALCLSRGVDQTVALYAAAKLGAPYVPLDPELPDDRLGAMLDDAAPAVVITDRATAGRVPAGSWQVLSFAEPDRWAGAPADDLPVEGTGHDLLHLLYTAGTTGRPTAVTYPVEGALADLEQLQRDHPLGPGDVALLETPDGCFWPLSQGATVAICPSEVHRDPWRLPEHVNAHGVTTLSVAPSMVPDVAEFPGELVTGYGLTETGRVTEKGRPAAHRALYVLDEALAPVPIGVAGELYVGGEIGLARGYHRRAALTAHRFVADPYGAPGARMFRTGDLGRYREDGVLEHLGPIDRQVRIHGLRVEPAEIEAAFTDQDGVWRAVVTAAPDGGLAAFVVPDGDRELPGTGLADGAARRLPDYLMPATVTVVDEIPRTGGGEIDVAALLDLRKRGADAAEADRSVAPETEMEARLAGIFCRVLRRDSVRVTESFFDMGGHSLLVFKLIEQCASELGLRPSVQDVFTGPSVRALAATLGAMRAASAGEDALVSLVENPGAPLVVLVHAASGSVLPFFEVAQRLGREFAVYALQSPPDAPPASIEEIAARYVEAVDAVRGVAPVVVAGWSMGGCVALEMARRWLHRDERVAATLLLDTWAPPSFMAAAADAAQVRGSILGLDVLRLEGAGAAYAALAELTGTVERNRAAFLDYRPEYYPAEVDLLRASDPLPAGAPPFPAGYMDGDRGWSAFAAEVATVEIKGSHLSLFDQEHADQLAAAISAAIARRMGYEEI